MFSLHCAHIYISTLLALACVIRTTPVYSGQWKSLVNYFVNVSVFTNSTGESEIICMFAEGLQTIVDSSQSAALGLVG